MRPQTHKLLTVAAVFVAVALAFVFSGTRNAEALTKLSWMQSLVAQFSPVFADPDTNAGSISGDTPNVLISDLNPATEGVLQRIRVVASDASDDLCVYWIAAGATPTLNHTCDGSSTDGIRIPSGSVFARVVAGDLPTCGLGSATPSAFHISSEQIY